MDEAPPAGLAVLPIAGLPLIRQGDDLAALIHQACKAGGIGWRDGDVLVLAQKIVSKAEGRLVALSQITPSRAAVDIAHEAHKDPRLVELILQESSEVMRARPGVIVVEHRLGMVLANAGIDSSNIDHSGEESALLLPIDPDGSARQIRTALEKLTGVHIAVLIIDSIGRAWRNGTIGTAIGASGVPTLSDLRGQPDLFGRPLATSMLGFADEIAAAASLVMGQGGEGLPAAVVRGLRFVPVEQAASDLLRPRDMDMFR
jgi:coenzyme F420-0:L-glutamate ligase / coenzyme F420-1:gamma-L-glutamate ligase